MKNSYLIICMSIPKKNLILLLISFTIIYDFSIYSQKISKYKIIQISNNNFRDTILLNGTLDGVSTYSELNYESLYDCNYYRAFEPMKSITISNKGNFTIKSPRFMINNKGNWFDYNSWTHEIFQNSNSEVEIVLDLWKFLKENRVHQNPSGWNSYIDYNMLICYGYGTCDNVTWMAIQALRHIGYKANYSFMVHHTVADIETPQQNYLLDSDLEVFYLNGDNNKLLGYSEVLFDKYFIFRTHHFGKSVKYDKNRDKWVSRTYYKNYPIGVFPFKNALKLSSEIGRSPYDFNLRPGETINYSWDDAVKYVHFDGKDTILPSSFQKYILANGKYTFNNNFKTDSLSVLFDSYKNLRYDSITVKSGLIATSDSAFLIVSIKSPFPIIDAYLKGEFFQESINDSIEIFWSNDNINYTKIAVNKRIGDYIDSLNLQHNFSYMNHHYTTPYPIAYNYYIKVLFHKSTNDLQIGINSLFIENIFQLNRRFLPTLIKGINSINYQDYNESEAQRNIEIIIDWQETDENIPPIVGDNPIFPSNYALIDSLNFGFSWNDSYDIDGDSIVDYEFFLSDRIDMKYPLSPNFNLYTSSFGNGNQAYFKAKENGWLNDGQIYYWKVRAKDSRGAWGEWSPIWSFTPKGVMRPVNLNYELSNDKLILSWNRNPKGKQPDYYKLYASDEDNGFVPDSSNLIATLHDSIYQINYRDIGPLKSFYRISACTSDSQESLCSDYVSLPYPWLFYNLKTISPAKHFSMKFDVNNKYHPVFYYKEDTIFNNPNITVDTIPPWLTFKNNTIEGIPDYTVARKANYIDSFNKVVLSVVNDSGYNKSYTFILESDIPNNPPSLYLKDSLAIIGKPFETIISTNDGDYRYGDVNNFIIENIPDWMNYIIKGDSIYLTGIPDTINNFDIITVRATDSKGESTRNSFKVQKYHNLSDNINIMPNPIKDEANILVEFYDPSILTIEVYSLQGVKIDDVIINQRFNKGVYFIKFNTSNLKKSIYILRFQFIDSTNNQVKLNFKKFIKM